ncbi:hypothetical protein FACS1894163_02250 [Spirochaetia bacterium]|nr:hypothetical protein FACS1894163_02250 [Spirochaetia bacterium]
MVPLLLASCSSAPKKEDAPLLQDELAFPAEEDILIEEEDIDELIEFPLPSEDLPVSSFGEAWAYLIAGEESALNARLPLSDVVYHSADINSHGKLRGVPNPKNVPRFGGRLHMDVMCNGAALTHFVLAPGSKERTELIADLLAAARNFDGLNIDFENVLDADGGAFLSFLSELRAGLGDKMLTIALPARFSTSSSNWYDYATIKPLVDRILLMAYDEHWSGSAPGPIASMSFCKRVADYAMKTIGPEKLIMGIPFYGRAWGHYNPSRAYYYSGIERVQRENNVAEVRRENGIPTFEYEIPVSVKVYYEDDYSLAVRMNMYRTMGINSVGFWRLGFETQAVWNLLKLEPLTK